MASAACALVVLSVLIAGALPARRATVSIRQALCWLYHVSRPPFGSLGPPSTEHGLRVRHRPHADRQRRQVGLAMLPAYYALPEKCV